MTLTVSSEGKVTAVSFYDGCSGWTYRVDRVTAACISRSVERWRYKPDPDTCDKPDYIKEDAISLFPQSERRNRAARLFRQGACGG